MLKKCIGSLGIAACYLNKKNFTNDLKLNNNSLSFSNLCSIKNFNINLGMRSFAESNISRNALHEKSLPLKNVATGITDDQGFDDNGIDTYLAHEGSKFEFNYDWRPPASSQTKKLLIFVAAPHTNNCGGLSPLGITQNECAAERMYKILSPRHPEYKRAYLLRSETQVTAEMVMKKLDVYARCGPKQHAREADPGRFDPKKCSDYNTDQCTINVDRDYLEDSFRIMVAGSLSACQVYLTHPNLIRYMVLKSMQFPMNAWKRFQVPPGSITLVKVLRSGDVVVEQIGAHFFHKTNDNEWLKNHYEN